jgi:hypothetical protein
MRRIITLICSIAAFSTAAFSQTITDTIETGAAYANDVYYSLKNGEVKSVTNSDWQLAFSIGVFNVAIRANTNTSSSGEGAVTIYECPETDMSKWTTFNTASYDTWPILENSDEDWETGAFNANTGDMGPSDYGWGDYDQTTHNVNGNRFFVVEIRSNGSFIPKKLFITSKEFGNWFIKYANLDGSNEKIMEVSSDDFAGKNFAYLSLLTDSLKNREPQSTSWDFMLTRYKGWQPQGQYYPVTGILTNMDVVTAEVRGVEEDSSTINDTTNVSESMSEIGSDWKVLNSQMNGYDMVDQLSYFVKAKDGAFWKLVFTGFAGSSNGQTIFNKTKVATETTGLIKTGRNVKNLAVYPNPSNDVMNVLFDVEMANTIITITDLTGKMMKEEHVSGNGFKAHPMNVSDLAKGIYLLNVTNGDSRSVQKIVIN